MIENDYELIHLAQEENEDAINYIYQKYKPIIIKKSNNAILKANHHGIEINDIMQEGYIALKEAIDNFREQDETTFYTFANLCIDRKISNYIKKNNTSKEKALNEAVFIDETLENVLSTPINSIDEVMNSEHENIIIKKLIPELSDIEKKVFNLKVKGYSFPEIANKLKKDSKSIYNTFNRIKIKLKKIMKDNN